MRRSALRRRRADPDGAWKEFLENYPEQIIERCFPETYPDIDFSRGVEFLDLELAQIIRRGRIGRKAVDKLLKVYLKNGGEEWLLLHVEIQGRREADFPERLFVYAYRLYEKYRRPITTLAILTDADPTWRPEGFGWRRWGGGMQHWFLTSKLLDFAPRRAELEASADPAAVMILAQLAVLELRRRSKALFDEKLALARQLLRGGFTRAQVESLFHLVDWMIDLPPELEIRFDDAVLGMEKESAMPFVTGIERRGMEKGRLETVEEHQRLLLEQLEARWGAVPEELRAAILTLSSPGELVSFALAAGSAAGPEPLMALLRDGA
jgi:hypothetical protein